MATQKTIFEFLDALRESGVTNMFGATPWLEKKFGMSSRRASLWLTKWMETFEDRQKKERQMKFVKVIKNDAECKQAVYHDSADNLYYLYSYINNDKAHETMVFACDENGEVEKWSELAYAEGYESSITMMQSVSGIDVE